MANTIQVLLSNIADRVKELSGKGSKIHFNENALSHAEEKFKKTYDEVMQNYMCKEVKCLDRHKVAAIFIKTVVEEKIVYSEVTDREDYLYVAAEMIATEIALSWMMSELNGILAKYAHKIKQYSMPIAFACSTPYFEIFARNLRLAADNYSINPMDVAEKLFLIEYITLLENGIPSNIIREW